ncbi:MAG: hypothetical protein AB7P01_18115 [Bacteroidia bacterium]
MNNEERLIEVMAELLAEVHEMRTDTKAQLTTLNNKVEGLNGRVDKLEGEMVKMNVQLAENTRAIIKLADKIETIPNIIERIVKLETTVYRKAS